MASRNYTCACSSAELVNKKTGLGEEYCHGYWFIHRKQLVSTLTSTSTSTSRDHSVLIIPQIIFSSIHISVGYILMTDPCSRMRISVGEWSCLSCHSCIVPTSRSGVSWLVHVRLTALIVSICSDCGSKSYQMDNDDASYTITRSKKMLSLPADLRNCVRIKAVRQVSCDYSTKIK